MSTDFVETIADGHVHLYPFMSPAGLLEAAYRNLSALAGPDQPLSGSRPGLLLVADPEGLDGFDRLSRIDGQHGTRWSRVFADRRLVVFRRRGGATLCAVKGQQLITQEGLEVLTLGDEALPTTLPLPALIDEIAARGGLSIIPWGAGKWLGRRGRSVSQVIRAAAGRRDILLADNGNRTRLFRRVPQFEMALERGLHVLAGSDPLPLKGEEQRAGAFGFRLRVPRPGSESLADAFASELRQPDAQVQILGEPMPLGRFLHSQLRLRLHNP